MKEKEEKKGLEIIQIGPATTAKGGVSASIAQLEQSLNSQRVKVTCIPTINPDSSFGLGIYLSALLRLGKRLFFYRPDLVHVHMASRGSFVRKSIVCLLCLAFRVPYIIHLHGGGFKDFYQGLLGFWKIYLRYIFKNASVVITLSEFWCEWVVEELTVCKAMVVHNGVKEINFLPEETNKSRPTILFLGLLGSNKGTDVLIEAMRKVNAVFPNAILELCGNGDLEFYKRQARDLPSVIFHGWVNEKERRAALARATIYCLPSWKEGLPFSILEAMSAGLPVISTPVGSIPEAVVDGVNGYLVPPGDIEALSDAITQLLLKPKLASQMGVAGKEMHRKNFSLSVMIEGCKDAYRIALNKL